MVDVLFALCEYLLPHLGRNGWEEQADLIKKRRTPVITIDVLFALCEDLLSHLG